MINNKEISAKKIVDTFNLKSYYFKIEEKNGVVYTPDFPTGVGYQNYDNWNKLLSVYLDAGLINENTVIFAHSIAPIFICHFLVEHRVKIKRLVFVCGFNNYLGIDEEYDKLGW